MGIFRLISLVYIGANECDIPSACRYEVIMHTIGSPVLKIGNQNLLKYLTLKN
jgi:hypothetical protein